MTYGNILYCFWVRVSLRITLVESHMSKCTPSNSSWKQYNMITFSPKCWNYRVKKCSYTDDAFANMMIFWDNCSYVHDVLAKGCTLDLHPSVFGQGICAQSNLAKANVLISMGHEPHAFDLIVRRSFSDYLLRWLKVATAEYTTEWSEP